MDTDGDEIENYQKSVRGKYQYLKIKKKYVKIFMYG